MRESVFKLFLIVTCFISVNTIDAQLTADAGMDKVRCENDSIQIGGTSSATGGTAPYAYSWETTYILGGTLIFHANVFLNDTTLANPIVIEPAGNMTILTFKLTVKDALNNIATDSMRVTFSGFMSHLGDNFAHINQGDSVQIIHSLGGGIPPITYQWSPNYALSNSTLESPWAKPDTTTFYVCTIADSGGCQTSFGDVFEVYVNPLSVDENVLNKNVKLYPNPSSSNLIIENVGQQKSDVTIEIISVTGKLVFAEKATAFDKVIVNTNEIPEGIHFVTVKQKNKTLITQKWVKVE